jgi:hypothetical protein
MAEPSLDVLGPLLASAQPQACHSMCGCAFNFVILITKPLLINVPHLHDAVPPEHVDQLRIDVG